MKGKVVALFLGGCLLAGTACTEQSPRTLRAARSAPTYVPPTDAGKPWLTLDIDTDNAVRYRDKVVFDPAVDDSDVLGSALESLREQAIAQGTLRTEVVFVADGPLEVAVGAFRVDVHQWAEWAAVAHLMRVTGQLEVPFSQIQLALLDVPD